jgi:hypothetical protein
MAKISHLLKDKRPLAIDLGEGETLNVVYRPGVLTPARHDEAIDLVEQQRVGAALAKSLSLSLVSWDLTGEEGEPYPVDEDTLRELPVRFLDMVFSAIQDDNVPNGKKSKQSAGSF